jgi:mono/diheme cytochrome c family protein
MASKIASRKILFLSFFIIFSLLLFSDSCLSGELQITDTTNQIALGRQIYRQGRLAGGKPVEAFVMGDMKVLGTQFICMNCHGRRGMGGAEGKTFTLAVNPAALFSPRKGIYLERAAYTDESLAGVLRTGKRTDGKKLSSAMPMYRLPESEMSALIAYLKTLSGSFSPGLTEDAIHFATVISDQSAPEAVKAMRLVLEKFFQDKNSRTRYEGKRQKYGPFYQHYRIKAYRDWALHIWQLHGSRESWQDQLANYYTQQPVFAMVSGMVDGAWAPVHEFCEQYEIPCLLPNTDVPGGVGSEDFYTMYFSEGLGLEARVIASAIKAKKTTSRVVQVFRAAHSGSFGADVVRRVLDPKVGVTVSDWVLASGEKFGWKELSRRIRITDADSVILWLPSKELENGGQVENEALPGPMYFSSSLLGSFFVGFPAIPGKQVKLAHPFNSPKNQEVAFKRLQLWLDSKKSFSGSRRVLGQTYYACMILGKGLAHIKNHFYRDYLLDALDHGNAKAMFSINYPRLSYGPGQRYLAKGAYIYDLPILTGKDGATEGHWIVPEL